MGHADSSSTQSGVGLLGVTRRRCSRTQATHLAALQGCDQNRPGLRGGCLQSGDWRRSIDVALLAALDDRIDGHRDGW
jgi:hypothetical protein